MQKSNNTIFPCSPEEHFTISEIVIHKNFKESDIEFIIYLRNKVEKQALSSFIYTLIKMVMDKTNLDTNWYK